MPPSVKEGVIPTPEKSTRCSKEMDHMGQRQTGKLHEYFHIKIGITADR
jgi:hypothetical protein